MKFKLKGRTLLNADIISPDMPYAQFDDGVTSDTVREIVNTLNCGEDMLDAYAQHADNLHITSVVELLAKLDEIYRRYDTNRYRIRRGANMLPLE